MTQLPSPWDPEFPYWDETGAYLYFLACESEGEFHACPELASDLRILAAEMGRLAHAGLQAVGRFFDKGAA